MGGFYTIESRPILMASNSESLIIHIYIYIYISAVLRLLSLLVMRR